MTDVEKRKRIRMYAKRFPALWDPVKGPIPGRGNATLRKLALEHYFGDIDVDQFLT